MKYAIRKIKKVFNAIKNIIKNIRMNKYMIDHEFRVANEIKRNKEELDKKIKELKEMEENNNVYDMDYNILKNEIRTRRKRLNEWEKKWHHIVWR